MFQKSVKVVLAVVLSILHVVVFCGQGYAAPTIKLAVSTIKLIVETDIYAGSEPVALTVEASGTNLKYEWSLEGPGEIEGEGASVLYKLPESIEGESAKVVVTVTVTDEQGEKSSESFTLTILAPEPTAAEEAAEEPAEAEEAAEEAVEEAGMSKTTKIAIGAGVAVAAGLGVALAVSGKDEEEGPFSGTFRGEASGTTSTGISYYNIYVFKLSQSGNSISGTLEITSERVGCCTAVVTVSVTGTADGNSATLSWESGTGSCDCGDMSWTTPLTAATHQVTLINDGQTLQFDTGAEYNRAKMSDSESECTLVPVSEFIRQ